MFKKTKPGIYSKVLRKKIVDDENWDEVAESFARIISVYQDELMRLQDYSRRKNGKNILKKT